MWESIDFFVVKLCNNPYLISVMRYIFFDHTEKLSVEVINIIVCFLAGSRRKFNMKPQPGAGWFSLEQD